MNQATPTGTEHSHITNRRFFARIYERLSRGPTENSFMDPPHRETAAQARWVVFEILPRQEPQCFLFLPPPWLAVEGHRPPTRRLPEPAQPHPSPTRTIHI